MAATAPLRSTTLTDPEPLLPTLGYQVQCHDATLIDLEAEGLWSMGAQLVHHHGLPRQVVVSGARRAGVDLVLREEGTVWAPLSLGMDSDDGPGQGAVNDCTTGIDALLSPRLLR